MSKVFIIYFIVISFLSVSCQDRQKEKQPIPQVPLQQTHDKQITSNTGSMSPHGNIKKTEKKVEVPDSVKKRWTRAVIVVEDIKGKGRYEQTVMIGSEFSLKGSNIIVKTGDFIPDFKMTDTVITTASNELNNPALRVEVFEGDKQLFKGWLYMKFPEVHAFEHERYSIRLIKAM